MKILLINNHDSFTYNLVQLLKKCGVRDLQIVANDELTYQSGENRDAVVISPGPGLPEEAGNLLPFLKFWRGRIPMLGICLGHQALAELFGGKLRQLNHILHGEKDQITLDRNDPLFIGIPEQIDAGRYHSWVVDENNFPSGLKILCRDSQNHIMGFRHLQQNVYGLQFHPESYMTPFGELLIFNWTQIVAKNQAETKFRDN